MRRYLINWLADGFHRYHATKRLYQKSIQADIRQGTRRDAVLFSVGANAQHGLKRTNKDKSRAVETLLNDPEWAGWSNREIARRAGVDEGFVRKIRDLSADYPQIENTERLVQRNGTVYTQNTTNIGRVPSNVIAPLSFAAVQEEVRNSFEAGTLRIVADQEIPPALHIRKGAIH